MQTKEQTKVNIIFDIGGVLVDWNPAYLYEKLIPDVKERERFFAEICTREWHVKQDAGRSWEDAVAEKIAIYPEEKDLIEAYPARWLEMFNGMIEGMEELFIELRAKYPTYAITNFPETSFYETCEGFPLLKEFDGVALSGALKLMKPDHAIFSWLCDNYNLDPETCIFIDDLEENVAAAQDFGMKALLFTNAQQLKLDLKAANIL